MIEIGSGSPRGFKEASRQEKRRNGTSISCLQLACYGKYAWPHSTRRRQVYSYYGQGAQSVVNGGGPAWRFHPFVPWKMQAIFRPRPVGDVGGIDKEVGVVK